MINLRILIIIILLSVVLTGCNTERISYKDGVYEGIGQGHDGPIKVKVTVKEKRITEIEIVEQEDTPYLCDIVYEKLHKRIIKANSTEVDIVAGATLTSKGLIEAVENALKDAKIEKVD